MDLNDLFVKDGIDPGSVLVLRHRPTEPEFRKVLPRLAVSRPDLFNAYQQTQTEKVEKAMSKARYVASFIGHEPGKAVFVGIYSVAGSKPLTHGEYWAVPVCAELKRFGMIGFSGGRESILWFDLVATDFRRDWKGKLIVKWPPPELSWFRWAANNCMPVNAILGESILDGVMPPWNEIVLDWEELSVLPPSWESRLREWRGIYFIFDESDGRGYVGSACGKDNLLGRWLEYAASGHGGNKLLRERDRRNFRYSILQRVSPDMDHEDVIRLESTWKERLHTRVPEGLNEN